MATVIEKITGRTDSLRVSTLIQDCWDAVFDPALPQVKDGRAFAVAAFTAGLHGHARSFDTYLKLYSGTPAAESFTTDAIIDAVDDAAAAGPFGFYREKNLARFSTAGKTWTPPGGETGKLLGFAHHLIFHPRDTTPSTLSGFGADDAVYFSQLVSFLAFHIRATATVELLGGTDPVESVLIDAAAAPTPVEKTIDSGEPHSPESFVNHPLGWVPWVEPLAEEELDDTARDALIKPERASWPYFRLLARHPRILKTRTLADVEIFHGPGGLSRALRELAATIVSRENGCVFCASVHAGRTLDEQPGLSAVVESLLENGAAEYNDTKLIALDSLTRALSNTPVKATGSHIAAARQAGFDDDEIADICLCAAFFNWANRLMLVLGTPVLPPRYR